MMRLFSLSLLLLTTPFFLGMYVFTPMEEKPDLTRFTDYVKNRRDYGKKTVPLPKETFVKLLNAGEWKDVSPKDVFKNPEYPYEKDKGLDDGCFTLDKGELYLWSIPRQGIIEIHNSKYETAYLFYPKEMIQLIPKEKLEEKKD